MPLWRIFSHPSTFTPTQRQGISSAITKLYSSLPPFVSLFLRSPTSSPPQSLLFLHKHPLIVRVQYVVVLFIDLPTETSCFVGGEAKTNFVRITVEQIARTMPDGNTAEGAASRRGWLEKINQVSPSLLSSFCICVELRGWEVTQTVVRGCRCYPGVPCLWGMMCCIGWIEYGMRC